LQRPKIANSGKMDRGKQFVLFLSLEKAKVKIEHF
jgi:hypothetical protein